MTLNLSVPTPDLDLKPRLVVVGVGGAGGNAVNNMIRSNLEGVEFVVANTDAQALNQSLAERKLQLGVNITQGLGAGARPDVGTAAAEEVIDDILDHLNGCHMTFITAGMGGGTGTGAAPVIARAARERGILTVGVVTKPFHFEGNQRMRIAESGIEELQQYVDTLIIIPNQNLFRVANEKTTFADAFKMADDVLYSGVRGVTDLMVMPGLINLDFADIRTVMGEMGKAMMGTGEAEGDKRAILAAESAISNPLLDDVTMRGAKGVLINITGGPDMTLFEVDEAANRIREEVDDNANIIFGSTFDGELEGVMRVSVVATGIDSAGQVAPRPILTGLTAAVAERVEAPAIEEPEAAVPEAIVPEPTVAVVEEPVYEAPAATGDGTVETGAPATSAEPAAVEPARPAASLLDLPVAEREPAFTAEPRPTPAIDEVTPKASENEPAPTAAAAEIIEERVAPREAFIPPRPAVAEPRPTASRPGAPQEAAVAGHDDSPGKAARRPSLFERVTGTGRARKPSETPNMQPAQAVPAAVPAAAQAEAPPRQEPTFEGVDEKPAPQTTRADEDMLEIPAFLRRQAN